MDFLPDTTKDDRRNLPAAGVQTDFPSETTRKERRSLLASGFAGIIITLLKINPTEIDVLGMKFSSPDLPLVAIAALSAAIIYLFVKFVTSYFYEESRAEMQNLLTQIRAGKAATDILQEEAGIKKLSLYVIEQRKIVQSRMENDERRFKERKNSLLDYDTIYLNAMKELDQERVALDKELARVHQDMETPAGAILGPHLITTIDQKIADLESRRKKQEAVIKTDQQGKLADLEQEIMQRAKLNSSELLDLDLSDEEAITKIAHIAKWKKADKTFGIASHVNKFLEFYFPLLVGLAAIVFLAWLAFHFPEPRTISLPPV